MSEYFEMLVDADATPSEAGEVATTVTKRLRDLGLISGDANPVREVGDIVYRPGQALADLYVSDEHNWRFWESASCEVEVCVRRGFNEWALGESSQGCVCHACEASIESLDDGFWDAIVHAIGEWVAESGPALLPCPACRVVCPITEWQFKPPLGFGNLSFRFWYWPPLDSPGWKLDIPSIVRDVSGHTIVKTYGKC